VIRCKCAELGPSGDSQWSAPHNPTLTFNLPDASVATGRARPTPCAPGAVVGFSPPPPLSLWSVSGDVVFLKSMDLTSGVGARSPQVRCHLVFANATLCSFGRA